MYSPSRGDNVWSGINPEYRYFRMLNLSTRLTECQFLDPDWRQFRFTVGAPDAEAKYKSATLDAQRTNENAKKYPSLFVCSFFSYFRARSYFTIQGFHGSGLKNWHSVSFVTSSPALLFSFSLRKIIRHGLWYKTVTNGRAYGDG